jgi:hypothetical protein
MRLIRNLSAFSLAALLSLSATASEPLEPQRLEAAKRLVAALDYKGQLPAMMDVIAKGLPKSIEAIMESSLANVRDKNGQALSVAKKAELRKLTGEFVSEAGLKMAEIFADPEIGRQMELVSVTSYAKNLSVDEMNAITEFNSSAAGKRFREITPKVAVEIMPETMKLIEPKLRQFQESLRTMTETRLKDALARFEKQPN